MIIHWITLVALLIIILESFTLLDLLGLFNKCFKRIKSLFSCFVSNKIPDEKKEAYLLLCSLWLFKKNILILVLLICPIVIVGLLSLAISGYFSFLTSWPATAFSVLFVICYQKGRAIVWLQISKVRNRLT